MYSGIAAVIFEGEWFGDRGSEPGEKAAFGDGSAIELGEYVTVVGYITGEGQYGEDCKGVKVKVVWLTGVKGGWVLEYVGVI